MNIKDLECTEKVVSDLMIEIARLRKENENLRIENVQIKAEKDEWKDGFTLLHNMMEQQNNTKYDDRTLFEKEDLNSDYENELTNAYAEAEKDFKFSGVNFSL